MTTVENQPSPEEHRTPRRRASLSGSTTPAWLWRVGTLLVVGCLLTALASVLAGTARVDDAGAGGDRLAALDFDASELYASLNGANASAATGFGADRTASPTMLARYDSYVTGAYLRLQHAQGLLEQNSADAASAESIGYQLPRYTSEVDAARALRDQGSPRAAAQLDSAAQLMTSTILPAADTLQQDRRAALAVDIDDGTAFPVVVVLLALVTLAVLLWVSVREARRTKRRFSVGLAAAVVALTLALVWWFVATVVATDHLSTAQQRNDVATDLSLVRVVMLQARAGETATIADGASGPTVAALQGQLAGQFDQVLAPGGLLVRAGRAGAADGDLTPVRSAVTAWQAALREAGIGSDASRVTFVRLTAAVTDGAGGQQGQRTTAIDAADAALTGIAVGPAVLAVLAALAVALGIRARLREYR